MHQTTNNSDVVIYWVGLYHVVASAQYTKKIIIHSSCQNVSGLETSIDYSTASGPLRTAAVQTLLIQLLSVSDKYSPTQQLTNNIFSAQIELH